ncbi:hypothetical protein B0H16DRAFT_715628 [Mycena metata]|uniref:F-box domain-containing protein n=1 Tax=Mycena metata TaxID=1033252 RepID=A0AAD7J2K0_9AGAR|nr:hypothetical protein B0H16DRAFT_715628 [Mycena metata]
MPMTGPRFRSLPTEILSEIFLHCSKEQDGCRPRPVAAVCKRWREVALSTSRLWCNIYLNSEEEEIETESLHSLLALQLERSGQVPLSVVFWCPHAGPSILELLLAVSHRWRTLDVNFLTPDQHEEFRTSTSQFPLLEKLTIRGALSLRLGNLYQPLPLLTELTLHRLSCQVPSNIPWTRLTKCTLWHSSPGEVMNILHSAPQIVELSLNSCYGDFDGGTATSIIRSLKIARCGRAFSQHFLARLSAPNLRELIIDDFDENGVTTQLTSLLTGSSCRMNHLSLCGVRISERELIAILHLTDALEHFEISWPCDVHSYVLMGALTIRPGNRPRLLPKLRTLSITGGLSCRNDDLLRMLESRCPGLERVELYYAGRTFFFDRALDSLRQAGMSITMLLDGPLDPFPHDETPD